MRGDSSYIVFFTACACIVNLSVFILAMRLACNLTQERFAEGINVDRRTVQRWEAGKHHPCGRSVDQLQKFYMAHRAEIVIYIRKVKNHD